MLSGLKSKLGRASIVRDAREPAEPVPLEVSPLRDIGTYSVPQPIPPGLALWAGAIAREKFLPKRRYQQFEPRTQLVK